MKRDYAKAIIVSAVFWLGLMLVAWGVAPKKAHSESWALVVLLTKNAAESWQVPTRGDSHAIPTANGCGIAANTLLPLWIRDHMPGWEVVGWWCVPDGEAETFIAKNRGENV